MSATASPAEQDAIRAWQAAYERTDLTARLLAATLIDLRNAALLPDLGYAINAQLDRFAQALHLEDRAQRDMERTRGTA